MKINIVTVSSGWILQKISERIRDGNKRKDVIITVSTVADPEADVNYYADLQNCYFGQKTKCDIAYFTHAHENSKDWALDLFKSRNAFSLNGIVSMNKRYTDMLLSIGVENKRITTIVPGETKDLFPLKKTKIGIVSRGGHEGYGQFFMEKLFSIYDLKHFEFNFLGNGWDNLHSICKNKKIEASFFNDSDYTIYPQFYNYIDYLLIPGLWTAGPMSMQEALSTGTPIIAANVGFVNYEFKADYVFEPNNTEQLYSILLNILKPKVERRQQVSNMSWEDYAEKLITFMESIKNI